MQVGQSLADRYHVLRRLSAGGMAATYLARDERSKTRVILKSPHRSLWNDSRFRARFPGDVYRLLGRDMPGFPTLLDVVPQADAHWFVLRYVKNGSLASRLGEFGGTMPLGGVLAWLVPVAGYLDWLHEFRVVHREVKPAHILFEAPTSPMLSDFTVVWTLRHLTVDLAIAGQMFCTPGYTPPEIVEGSFTPAYDQFSLAAVAFRALTGYPPHAYQAVLGLSPVLGDHLPSRAVDAFQRALAPDPTDRFPTCMEFAEAVRRNAFGPLQRVSPDETMFLKAPAAEPPAIHGPEPSAGPTPDTGKRGK